MLIRQTNKERGQVMLLGLVIVIILGLVVLFLFDLQLAVRAKMKVETAEQSAALAAAEWQRNSLNLIGELNLIKACDAMLENYEPADVEDNGQNRQDLLDAARRTLTEMQSRIAFVGPMIAFGAAQQAAKYNGINIFDHFKNKKDEPQYFNEDEDELQYFNEDEDVEDLLADMAFDSDKKTVYDDIRRYRLKLDYDRRYTEPINHYRWKEPYKALLADIRERGLAVRPSGLSYMTMVDPSWLKIEDVYDTCLNLKYNGVENIAGILLKNLGILYLDDSFWEGKWWQISYRLNDFPRQSEIYPLYVDFSPSNEAESNKDLEYYLGAENVYESRALSNFRWCVFNLSQWEPEYLDEMWLDRSFLRDELKPGAIYQGAIAMASTYERIATVSKHRIKNAPSEYDFNQAEKQAWRTLRMGREDSALLRKSGNMEFRIGSDVRLDGNPGGAVARPVGQLNDETPPYLSSMVLPVFHNTAMMPSTMFATTAFQSSFTNLERFLVWLGKLSTFDPPAVEGRDESGETVLESTAPPAGTAHYYEALLWLANPENRKSIFNPAFTPSNYSSMAVPEYFQSNYKYDPIANPEGAGWLQQAYVGPLAYEASRENLYTQIGENGEPIIMEEKKYDRRGTAISKPFILYYKDRGVRPPLTNEEYYLYTRIPGRGGYSRGKNIGPAQL